MTSLLTALVSISIGLGLGVIFFWLLKINSELYLRGKTAWFGVLAHIARLAILVLIFWYVANFGAGVLLSSFGGFLLGRLIFMKFLLKEEL